MMITKEQICGVLKDYDKEEIKIATLGSHSALQIMKGAKDEGFRNITICTEKAARFYKRWPVVDEILVVSSYKDILRGDMQDKLIEENAILIPHGSFVEYVGAQDITRGLGVPMHGNRLVLEWESDRMKEGEWFRKAGVKTPRMYKDPSEIDCLCIVKFHGARGGKGYFLVRNEEEFHHKVDAGDSPKNAEDDWVIQEYVVGTRFYPHFFYSPLNDDVELLGMDVRYESNVDGLSRIPHIIQKDIDLEPSYVVTGNTPVVLRESLLPDLMRLGRNIVEASKKLFPPGLIGPFCVEMICNDQLEFICFEMSARIVAGTNLFIHGSTYSKILYDDPMSCGRRISREIRNALRQKRLDEVIY
ncbi:MAG: formate--phosphoribosylaminoimidazolecarboxamide ligase [Candidatus Altiarchaeales archaeon]|nr:formate--phosphoribosylaminoimidazolecarboxamide ligase [Candidatus Altiarchaeales archaeon]